MLCLLSSQFLANSCSQDTVFSSIFSCVNNAGDLKMAARYFTLEEVLERVEMMKRSVISMMKAKKTYQMCQKAKTMAIQAKVRVNSSKIAMVLVGLCSLFTFGEKYLSFTNNFTSFFFVFLCEFLFINMQMLAMKKSVIMADVIVV